MKLAVFKIQSITLIIVASVCFGVCLADGTEQKSRTWTSTCGKFKIDAQIVQCDENSVTLRKSNGDIVTVSLERLCENDRTYAAEFLDTTTAESSASVTVVAGHIRTYSQLLKATGNCQTASEAMALVQLFIADKTISEKERKTAEEQLSVWEGRVKDHKVRFGITWMDPELAKSQKAQANRLIEEAFRLIEVDQGQAAIAKLCEASNVDPEQIRADFILGLGYALLIRDATKAQKSFAECISRKPMHAGALNNCALAEVRVKNYGAALAHWQMALEAAPASQEVIQNIGKLVGLAGQRRIYVPPTVLRKARDLYATIAATTKASPYDDQVGWLYIPFCDPDQPREKKQTADEPDSKTSRARIPENDPAKQLRLVASGSGFMVYDEYIATNRHVVCLDDGVTCVDGVKVVLSEEGVKKRHRASIVAISQNPNVDLAVLKVDGLHTNALPITKQLKKGGSVLIIGFPGIGNGAPVLTVTRGVVSILPGEHELFGGMFAMDAAANHGNSGGPVCDDCGNVCGVTTIITNDPRLCFNYSGATAPADLIDFLQKHIPKYSPIPLNTKPVNSEEITDQVGKSTVLVESLCYPMRTPLPDSYFEKRKKSWKALEDPWCITCYGTASVHCPNTSCKNGTVRDMRTDVMATNPVTGTQHGFLTPVRVPCKVCNGKAQVKCPDCDSHGFDRATK